MEALKIPFRVLNFTGMLPKEKSPVFRKIRGIFFYYINFLFVSSMIVEVYNHLDDFSALSRHLSVLLSPTTYLFKITVFITKEKYFSKVLKMMKKNEFTDHSKELQKFVTKSVKLTIYIRVIYQWFCTAVIILYALMPLIENVDLPIMFSYDIGVHKSIIYAFQVLSE